MSNPKGCSSKEHSFKVGDKVIPFPTEFGTLSAYLVAGSTYTITKIRENGRVDVEGTFKNDGNGTNWDSDWFKPYEEKEVKLENTMTAESLRNSILSLQEERVSLQEKIEQNIAQEKSLTEQLKELGFLLVESEEQPTNVVDKKKTVLYAEDIEEDMTDPRNLQVGDVIECLCAVLYPSGTLAVVVAVDETTICRKAEGEKFEGYFDFASFGELWKFHSRPVVS